MRSIKELERLARIVGGERLEAELAREKLRAQTIGLYLKRARRLTAAVRLTCWGCGKPMLALRLSKKFCSTACRVSVHRTLKRRDPQTIARDKEATKARARQASAAVLEDILAERRKKAAR